MSMEKRRLDGHMTMMDKQLPSPRKILIAFDFDHTICQDNTDIFVLRLLEGAELPAGIQSQRKTLGWTRYMGEIFAYLHSQGISSQTIRAHMQRTPLVNGMLNLFEHIRMKKHLYDCIIISDSNSLFIWYILHYTNLEDVFPANCVYTNPARLDEHDCLRIDYYHHNTRCQMSADNLCKGRVLHEHIQRVKQQSGQGYSNVLFVGDGMNDYCPSSRLTATDFVAARCGFKLLDKLKQETTQIQAKIVPWTDGHDLLAFIHSLEQRSE